MSDNGIKHEEDPIDHVDQHGEDGNDEVRILGDLNTYIFDVLHIQSRQQLLKRVDATVADFLDPRMRSLP